MGILMQIEQKKGWEKNKVNVVIVCRLRISSLVMDVVGVGSGTANGRWPAGSWFVCKWRESALNALCRICFVQLQKTSTTHITID
jgi:hypothetical protein